MCILQHRLCSVQCVQSRTTGTGRSCTKGGTFRCLVRYDFLGVRLTSTVQLYRVEASPIFPPINLTQDVIDVKGSSKGGGQVGGNWRSHRAGRGRELQGTTLIGQLAQFGSCDRSRPVFVLPVTECYALFTHTHTGFVCGWHSWVASSRRARLSQEKRSMRYVNPKNAKNLRERLPPSLSNQLGMGLSARTLAYYLHRRPHVRHSRRYDAGHDRCRATPNVCSLSRPYTCTVLCCAEPDGSQSNSGS